jgi:hypothetical protein
LRTEKQAPAPAEPESIEQLGLPESTIESLIFKTLYTRGDLYGGDLAHAMGLRYSVFQELLEALKMEHLVVIKRSIGVGGVGSIYSLSDAGKERARELMESDQYVGPAPVPLDQYKELVAQQRPAADWLTRDRLATAFKGLVVTERIISQIGPAISSANSLLIYGKPGDGKTALIEALANLDARPVFIPFAIECQGNIIQVFDPVYHFPIPEEEPSVLSVARTPSYDRRWIKCRRPFIVTGGELTMDMLDLRFNHTSKVYEAPFQLKANNGIYLVDDFGRQRATPAEVLNRWIVPMERHIDYLAFLTGGKMSIPFETFLVFSTNLNPSALGDEAFLRRIQYKMLLRGPAENEFIRIFEGFCAAKSLPCTRDTVTRFVQKHYKQTGKLFRRCHPRDVLCHLIDLIQFERLPYRVTDQLLDRAFDSCFLDESDQAEAPVAAAPAAPEAKPPIVESCSDLWGDRLAQINTAFGSLAYFASYRDPSTLKYHDSDSAWKFGETETASVLARLHQKTFQDWVSLTPDQQARDLARYLASNPEPPLRLSASGLAPFTAQPDQIAQLARMIDAHIAVVQAGSAAPVAPPAPAAAAQVVMPMVKIA